MYCHLHCMYICIYLLLLFANLEVLMPKTVLRQNITMVEDESNRVVSLRNTRKPHDSFTFQSTDHLCRYVKR
jgi:hypothetical protein